MIFNLRNPYEEEKFNAHVRKIRDDRCIVEIKRVNPSRSLSQNAYLHLLLGYFGCQYGCSRDEAKVDFFKRHCNPDLFVRETDTAAGRRKFLRSSSELSTAEMTLAIDRFRNFSASEGIYLPAAGEKEFIIHCRQETEKAKEYL